MNEPNVDKILQSWYDAKQQISELESKIDDYKKIASNIMDNKNIDCLKNDQFVLQKKDMNRTSISKSCLPVDIWNTYSKESLFSAFYISKINHKKKRSPKK